MKLCHQTDGVCPAENLSGMNMSAKTPRNAAFGTTCHFEASRGSLASNPSLLPSHRHNANLLLKFCNGSLHDRPRHNHSKTLAGRMVCSVYNTPVGLLVAKHGPWSSGALEQLLHQRDVSEATKWLAGICLLLGSVLPFPRQHGCKGS